MLENLLTQAIFMLRFVCSADVSGSVFLVVIELLYDAPTLQIVLKSWVMGFPTGRRLLRNNGFHFLIMSASHGIGRDRPFVITVSLVSLVNPISGLLKPCVLRRHVAILSH